MHASKIVTLMVCLALISPALADGQTEQQRTSLEKEREFDFSDFNPEQWVINQKNTQYQPTSRVDIG